MPLPAGSLFPFSGRNALSHLRPVHRGAGGHPGGAGNLVGGPSPAGVAAVLLVPLIADGLLQLCTPYESGNLRRLATGLLFGYGLTVLLLTSLGWAYQWGFGFGKTLLDP